MKIKLQSRIIDFNIIEQMVFEQDVLIVDYNNGRSLSFGVKRPKEENLVVGTIHEVQKALDGKRLSEGLSMDEMKKKYGLANLGNGKYGITDNEGMENRYAQAKIEFAEKVEKVMQHWNEYQHDHVMLL